MLGIKKQQTKFATLFVQVRRDLYVQSSSLGTKFSLSAQHMYSHFRCTPYYQKRTPAFPNTCRVIGEKVCLSKAFFDAVHSRCIGLSHNSQPAWQLRMLAWQEAGHENKDRLKKSSMSVQLASWTEKEQHTLFQLNFQDAH